MKKLIGVWLFVLLAGPAFAQTSLIGDIAAERAKYPASMTPAQVAQMLNAVAWSHRAEGWGLLRPWRGIVVKPTCKQMKVGGKNTTQCHTAA